MNSFDQATRRLTATGRKALIILYKGQALTEKQVINYCKAHLASYKKPKSVEFLDDLPRSTSGKVLKRKLREKYWRGVDRGTR